MLSLFCTDVTVSFYSYFSGRQVATNPKSALCVIRRSSATRVYQSILMLRPLLSILCHYAVAPLIGHEGVFQEFITLVVLMGKETLVM